MNKFSIYYIRAILIIKIIFLVFVFYFLVPNFSKNLLNYIGLANLNIPFVTGIFLLIILYILIIRDFLKLLEQVYKKTFLSEASLKYLKNIRVISLFITSIGVLILPIIYLFSQKADSPGGIIIGFAILILLPPALFAISKIHEKIILDNKR